MKKNVIKILSISVLFFTPLLFGVFFIWSSNNQEHSSEYLKIRPLVHIHDLDPLLEQARQADYVLLGESSHGTSEYYLWRSRISQRLISEHDFAFLALEGDWDAIYELNLYVKHLLSPDGGARQIMSAFDRWPTWMWANEEFLEFVEWLREHNSERELSDRVGVYGKDIYGANKSMRLVVDFLANKNPDLASIAAASYDCLLKYDGNLSAYVDDIYFLKNNCRQELSLVLEQLEGQWFDEKDFTEKEEAKAYFNALQNARVAVYAEEHYRKNLMPGSAAWNARVLGMKSMFSKIVEHQKPGAKGIIWAHNTHVGDARATEMAESGMVNIGQLMREEFGIDKIFIIGFGTNGGTVLAGTSWGAPAQVMTVPPAQIGSFEHLLAGYGESDFMIFLKEDYWREKLRESIGHRAKGVVYNPIGDHRQYVSTFVPSRYNAFVFLDQTTSLRPLVK